MSLRNAALIFFIALAGCGQRPTHGGNNLAQKQAEVVDRGRSVMPFDIVRTMHHFRKSPSGGVEEVLSVGLAGLGQLLVHRRFRLHTIGMVKN